MAGFRDGVGAGVTAIGKPALFGDHTIAKRIVPTRFVVGLKPNDEGARCDHKSREWLGSMRGTGTCQACGSRDRGAVGGAGTARCGRLRR